MALPASSRAADFQPAPAWPANSTFMTNSYRHWGWVSSVDTNAMTFDIAGSGYSVSPKARIVRGRKAATFAEIHQRTPVIVGEYQTDAKGGRTATMIRIIDIPGARPGTVYSMDTAFSSVVNVVDPATLALGLGSTKTDKVIALPSTPITMGGKPVAFTNIVAGARLEGHLIPDASGELYLVDAYIK